ncbi:MAG: hypothetical protein Ct9H300mP22_0830 [Gammaproteobacteria bacterium]|nr:MAG: hypothetical protein Ct9H300mP22_0830 [Gammaproteobacteria bacterium]
MPLDSHQLSYETAVSVKREEDVAPALMKLLIVSSGLMAAVMFFFTMALIPEFFELNGEQYTAWAFIGASFQD